jgi:hypothetical protein
MSTDGLMQVGGCDNPNRVANVVFVHGLGGSAQETWMADAANADTFWPTWVAADFPNVGVWTLGFAADVSKWKAESMPLADRGNSVLEQLSNKGLGRRPLIFIVHSLGGIIVKQVLRHAESFGVPRWAAIAKQTRGIAFIATPHSGANIASFAQFISAVLRTNEQVAELGAHNSRLRELHGWFLNTYLESREFVIRTYCERREVRPEIFGLKLPKGILVVDETSAELNYRRERAIPLDEDHISICKPVSRDRPLYDSIRGFLEDCLNP